MQYELKALDNKTLISQRFVAPMDSSDTEGGGETSPRKSRRTRSTPSACPPLSRWSVTTAQRRRMSRKVGLDKLLITVNFNYVYDDV